MRVNELRWVRYEKKETMNVLKKTTWDVRQYAEADCDKWMFRTRIEKNRKLIEN